MIARPFSLTPIQEDSGEPAVITETKGMRPEVFQMTSLSGALASRVFHRSGLPSAVAFPLATPAVHSSEGLLR